jgi:hypothetical protein
MSTQIAARRFAGRVRRRLSFVAAPVAATLAVCLGAFAPSRSTPLPPFVDGVTAIVSILDSVPLVAIMDEHLLAQEGEFYQRLIRDPRFAKKANDIVVEFGNELYQSVADRYVRGERVPLDSLRMIWEDNTQGPLLTTSSPMYADILHVTRAVNASLQPRRRMRVLLGDPAVEWKTITREQLWEVHKQRGDRMRELARDSVVGKGRRGIIIGGGTHLHRDRQPASEPFQDGKWKTLGDRVFIVDVHQGFGGTASRFEPVMDSLPLGSLLRVRGTFLESIELDDALQQTPVPGDTTVVSGPPTAPPGMRRPDAGLTLADHIDALLYLGPIRSYTAVFADVDRIRRDPARLAELNRRSCMMTGRGVDTTRMFRTPKTAPLYANGVRRSRVKFEPINDEEPRALPALPTNLPEPCATLLRR